MNDRVMLFRRLRYVVMIVVMLVPLSWLSMPSSSDGQGGERGGGKLAQLRKDYKLSQSNLGDIDPASETMKLATLGLRGVAANILWEKANYYKKTEDWTNLSATLEQITKLQPNFVSVWKFQAWNLSYNVSVEFDDYRDRYYWVMRGIYFLKQGIKYNEDSPRLLEDLGWFIGQKIGRADEHVQFRRLFKDDDDFHDEEDPSRPRDQRDNWLVGRLWFLKGYQAVDYGKRSLGGKSPLIFFSNAAMSLMNYAEALGEDGVYGELARIGWQKASQAWQKYGDRDILSSRGFRIQLNNFERKDQEAKSLRAELEAIGPEVLPAMLEERQAKLTDPQKAALEVPAADRDPSQAALAYTANRELEISTADLLKQIQKAHPERAREAARVARLWTRVSGEARTIDRYRDIVNFKYWRTRAKLEQTDEALRARRLIYEGQQAFEKDSDFSKAQRLYEEGMANWRIVLDQFPSILDEGTTGDDLIEVIEKYAEILRQASIEEGDEMFPEDFPLRDVIELHDREGKFKTLLKDPAQTDGKTPGGSPLEGAPPEPN